MAAGTSSHAFGRDVLQRVWRDVTGQDPTLPELQLAGAQATLESGYGRGAYTNKLTGEKQVLNNWGAMQAGKGPPCDPATAFETTDTHADGTPYQWCYRKFATPEDGARAFLHIITNKRPAAWERMRAGDIDGYAAALRESHYFEAPLERYASALETHVNAIAAALGEPVSATRGGPPSPPANAPPDASSLEGDGTGPGVLAAIALGLAAAAWWIWRGR